MTYAILIFILNSLTFSQESKVSLEKFLLHYSAREYNIQMDNFSNYNLSYLEKHPTKVKVYSYNEKLALFNIGKFENFQTYILVDINKLNLLKPYSSTTLPAEIYTYDLTNKIFYGLFFGHPEINFSRKSGKIYSLSFDLDCKDIDNIIFFDKIGHSRQHYFNVSNHAFLFA